MSFLQNTTLFLFTWFFSFCTATIAQSSIMADSLTVQWERLDGPAAYVAQYAQNGSLLFASSEEALFSSADQGLSWQYNLAFGRKRIRQIFANEKMVLVLAQEPRATFPDQPFSQSEMYQLYRSADGGQSWQQVLGLIQEPEAAFPNVPYEIMALNDSTIVVNYLNFTSVSNTEHLYASSNDGIDWSRLYQGAKILQACRDTLAFIYAAGNPQTLTGKITPKLNFAVTQSIDLGATGASLNGISNVGYHDQTFFLFMKDKTLWSTRNLGVSWESNVLPISGDLQKITWADSAFFALSSTGVYRANTSTPLLVEKIYAGAFSNTARVKTFSNLPMGYWINTNLSESISSSNGQDWMPRSKGLSSKAGQIRAECGALRVQSLGKDTDQGGWYYSDASDANWVLHPEPINCCPLGSYGGYLFRYATVLVQRSADCGASWENLPVVVTAQPSGLWEHQGRLFLYTQSDKIMHVSDDYGASWQMDTVPDYGIYKMFSFNGQLLAFGPKIYRSSDLGASWLQQTQPLPASNHWINGSYLLSINNNYLEDGQVRIYKTASLDSIWHQTAHFSTDTCGNYYQFSTKLMLVSDSLILMHHNFNLYISGSQGEHWTQITNPPFNKRALAFCPSPPKDTMAGQATSYFINEGFLYAASEAHGLWRSPLQPFYAHLFKTSWTQEPVQKHTNFGLEIFPNPASQAIGITFNQDFPPASPVEISVYYPSGVLALHQEFVGAQDIRVGLTRLDPGLYFIVVKSRVGTIFKRFMKI